MRAFAKALKLIFPLSSIFFCCLVWSSHSKASVLERGGKPALKPPPPYCQNGECFVVTIETIDPVGFSEKGVLFRVESQNWRTKAGNMRALQRAADSTSYVLCSKKTPAVLDQTDEHKYMVTFLAPTDTDSYSHSTESALAVYFTVCHSRSFDKDLYASGPEFAHSLGYVTKSRDDQPVIDSPDKIFDVLK